MNLFQTGKIRRFAATENEATGEFTNDWIDPDPFPFIDCTVEQGRGKVTPTAMQNSLEYDAIAFVRAGQDIRPSKPSDQARDELHVDGAKYRIIHRANETGRATSVNDTLFLETIK